MTPMAAQKKTAAPAKTARTLQGTVVSDKMDKTIVVRVDSLKLHPKYRKRYKRSEKYKVHDEKNEYAEGDVVRFVECRPISKDKCWRVIGKV
jgi:small subunit ribosomal protein S17